MTSTALTRGDILSAGLIALPGVYRPQADTRLLAEALTREDFGSRRDVLEIGTGTGALALHAAGRGARVTAVDVAWPAVVTARLNALRRRVPLRVLHGDFAARTEGRRYDLVVANPPYVPAPATRPPRTAPSGPGTRAPTGAMSSTGSVRGPRPSCVPVASCSWCTRGCAGPRRPSTGWPGRG